MKELLIRAIIIAHYNYVNFAKSSFLNYKSSKLGYFSNSKNEYLLLDCNLFEGSFTISNENSKIHHNAIFHDVRLVNYHILKILGFPSTYDVYWSKLKIIVKNESKEVVFTTNRIKRIAWSTIRLNQLTIVDSFSDLDEKEKYTAIRCYVF